jgi:hypothetical protein
MYYQPPATSKTFTLRLFVGRDVGRAPPPPATYRG